MSHAIPVAASHSDPAQPVGDLILELFWVTAVGDVANELGAIPVQNGVAVFDGPALPAGLFWAIRVQRTATPGALFRSGPLAELPGPPSPVISHGVVAFRFNQIGFSLSNFGSDGVPEVLVQHLQQLPAPLTFLGVELGADLAGNYRVTVRGRLRFLFFWLSFVYRRTVRLVGNLDPGHPARPVVAELVGPASGGGLILRRYAAVLDRQIVEGVERQLASAVMGIATLELQRTGADFSPQTVSVNGVHVSGGSGPPRAHANMTLSGGAITGLIAPPTPSLLDPN
jgi:hypothetical protein